MPFPPAISVTSPRYYRVWVILVLSIAVITVMSAFLSQSLATLHEGVGWVAHTERVRFELARIQQSLSDLGGGVAGYQLTQDESLFAAADAAARAIELQLADLHTLVADNPPQQPLVAQLMELARQRIADTQGQRQRALRGDTAAVEAQIAGGSAKRIMDASRNVVAQMQDEEKRQLELHTAATQTAYSAVAFAIWAAAAVAILLLIAVTLVTVRDAEQLRRMQEELATILRSVGDAVIATDAAGRVRFINAVAEQLTGWQSSEARGLPLEEVFQLVDKSSGETMETPVARVLSKNTVIGLADHPMLRARDGTQRPVEDSGAPIRGTDGKVTGVVLVFRDATSEHAARQALIDSRDALRAADHRKDVFLATLSHELRNPLAPIRTASRVLETPGISAAESERSRSIISRQVRHMASLLDDLLDISRITRGVLSLKTQTVELRGLLEAAVETAQPLFMARGHELRTEWPPATLQLEADPVRLTQVVANLLANAAKYTKPHGRIVLRVAHEGNEAIISVHDNGIGIAGEMLPRVFDMFSQIESGQELSEGGIGIGLALVKSFVELHGGHVEARSAGRDRGSEFIVRMPGVRVVAAKPARHDAASVPLDPPTRCILVADDNRDGAEILAMLLDQSGYAVHLAFSGTDALALAAEKSPDIAILDIGMPGLSGYEVARRIRAQSWGTRMRLIAVTGWGQDEDKRAAAAAGFDHHLTKPIDPDALDLLIRSA